MDTTLTRLGKQKIKELLAKCTPRQVEMFNRMYRSVDEIPPEKIDWAIQQCERTITKSELTKIK